VSAAWIVVAVLAVATVSIKAAGPLSLGRRRLPPRVTQLTGMLAPALLGGLVVQVTVGASTGSGVHLDARLVGLGVAVAALALRAPMLLVVVLAAAATAVVRAPGL
jgi:branched-subunit amino acid transport protein